MPSRGGTRESNHHPDPRIRVGLPRIQGGDSADPGGLDPRRHQSDDARQCHLAVASARVRAITCMPLRPPFIRTARLSGRGRARGLCGYRRGRTLGSLRPNGQCSDLTGPRPPWRLSSCKPGSAAITIAGWRCAARSARARWQGPWAWWRTPAQARRRGHAVRSLGASHPADRLPSAARRVPGARAICPAVCVTLSWARRAQKRYANRRSRRPRIAAQTARPPRCVLGARPPR